MTEYLKAALVVISLTSLGYAVGRNEEQPPQNPEAYSGDLFLVSLSPNCPQQGQYRPYMVKIGDSTTRFQDTPEGEKLLVLHLHKGKTQIYVRQIDVK